MQAETLQHGGGLLLIGQFRKYHGIPKLVWMRVAGCLRRRRRAAACSDLGEPVAEGRMGPSSVQASAWIAWAQAMRAGDASICGKQICRLRFALFAISRATKIDRAGPATLHLE